MDQGRGLLIATTNPHKTAEFARLWRGLPFPLSDLTLSSDYPVPEETGVTYLENAVLKASAAARWSGVPSVADDSGLEVAALGGRPGVRSARYADGAPAPAQRRQLLAELEAVPDARRDARFVCVLAVCAPDGDVLATAEAAIAGRIARAERGEGGFGYDPIFWVPWLGATLAEVPPPVKDAVSHRGRAARMLWPKLRRLRP